MKIGIVTVMQERGGIETKFLESAIRLKEETKAEVEIITVPYDSTKELGGQFNTAIHKAKHCDYVFITGSDDIYTSNLFNKYIEYIEQGFNYIGLLDFYFYDTQTDIAYYFGGHHSDRKGEPLGAARMISAEVLNEVGWNLWAVNAKFGLDKQASQKLSRSRTIKSKFVRMAELGVVAVDLKSDYNIWQAQDWNVKKTNANKLLKSINV